MWARGAVTPIDKTVQLGGLLTPAAPSVLTPDTCTCCWAQKASDTSLHMLRPLKGVEEVGASTGNDIAWDCTIGQELAGKVVELPHPTDRRAVDLWQGAGLQVCDLPAPGLALPLERYVRSSRRDSETQGFRDAMNAVSYFQHQCQAIQEPSV